MATIRFPGLNMPVNVRDNLFPYCYLSVENIHMFCEIERQSRSSNIIFSSVNILYLISMITVGEQK